MFEEKLEGGNVSDVHRVGDRVYRAQNPNSKTIHRFLDFLAEHNFNYSPRFLGIDESNREVLSFMEGTVGHAYPDGFDIETVIINCAKVLREFHDIGAQFENHKEDSFYLSYDGVLAKTVMCHNDFAPYNLCFKGNTLVGMIDFDTLCPGPREYDIVYALYRLIPLKNYQAAWVHLFLKTYGYEGDVDLKSVLIERLEALATLIEVERAQGNPAFITMYENNHHIFYRDEIQYLKEKLPHWGL